MKQLAAYIPLIVFVVAACSFAAGVFMGEHHMIFAYAIVICLNCMGIG